MAEKKDTEINYEEIYKHIKVFEDLQNLDFQTPDAFKVIQRILLSEDENCREFSSKLRNCPKQLFKVIKIIEKNNDIFLVHNQLEMCLFEVYDLLEKHKHSFENEKSLTRIAERIKRVSHGLSEIILSIQDYDKDERYDPEEE